jgi:Flp pilus assembly protein CpaB
LIAAVVLGVLATVLAFTFIQSAAGTDRGPKTRIVVAKHDLKPNAVIDPERDLQVEEIPARFGDLAAQSLDWESRSNYKGQRLNRRVLARQPIFLADLSAAGELDLAPGARALTIPAEPGIVIPGDYVKVVVPRPDYLAAAQAGAGSGGNPGASAYQVTIIGRGNGYRVLAVGGSLFKTRQQVTAADQYESGSAASKTVTLEVTEEQAAEIMRAAGNTQQKATLLLCMPRENVAATQP